MSTNFSFKGEAMKKVLCLTSALGLFILSTAVQAQPRPEERQPGSGRHFLAERGIKVPVLVDGVRYEPNEMSAFDGQTLYWVIDRTAIEQGFLYAFTTPEGAREYGREHASGAPRSGPGVARAL